MNIIEIKNLEKTYKNKFKALNNISFEVKNQEILGLLGPNGSGKTTTINCILSLLEYQGEINVNGKDIMKNTEYKKEVGVVFQDVAVFNELTVYDNIDYFCGLYIKDKMTRKKYVEEAIDFVGLKEYKKFYPNKLSGGLLRRLNIACGISHKPKIIFFDEPTVAVDPQSRNKILENIKDLNKQGATIIYTSHYMEEVEILCDRIIVIDKGVVLAVGTKDELIEKCNFNEKIDIYLEADNQNKVDVETIAKIKGVYKCYVTEDHVLKVRSTKNGHNLTSIMEYLSTQKIAYNKIITENPSLNDCFLELTGKDLRD